MNDTKTKGLKRLTKANSTPVRMAKGGKELTRDTSKKRLYKVASETDKSGKATGESK